MFFGLEWMHEISDFEDGYNYIYVRTNRHSLFKSNLMYLFNAKCMVFEQSEISQIQPENNKSLQNCFWYRWSKLSMWLFNCWWNNDWKGFMWFIYGKTDDLKCIYIHQQMYIFAISNVYICIFKCIYLKTLRNPFADLKCIHLNPQMYTFDISNVYIWSNVYVYTKIFFWYSFIFVNDAVKSCTLVTNDVSCGGWSRYAIYANCTDPATISKQQISNYASTIRTS